MYKVRALVLEREATKTPEGALRSIFDSSPEFALQIERHSFKIFEHEFPTSVFDYDIIIPHIGASLDFPPLLAAMPEIKKKFPGCPVLAVIETDESKDISSLLELGPDDFVISPIKPGEIILRIRRLLEKNTLEDFVSQSFKQKFGLKQMIGESASFLSEIKKIPLLAKSDVIVLITGETGTGKELCARAIHYLSPRSRGPFIPINCGAIPVDLVENELFGHEKGAFTGATEARTGLIAEAE